MISEKIEKALNGQLVEESYSSNLYLSMASWCEKAGLRGSASFLYEHAEEERGHMKKIFAYINEAAGHAQVPTVKEVPLEFKSLLALFEAAMAHERHITKCIYELVELSMAAKDHATTNFLQWFVAEQLEEEKVFQTILDILKYTGSEPRGIYFADKEIRKLVKK
jgi:ferritin